MTQRSSPFGGAAIRRPLPIEVTSRRVIAATPEALLAQLSEPQRLAAVMPRVKSIEVLERTGSRARVAAVFGFEPFGSFRTEGEVWVTENELVFRSEKPAPVESRWTLRPVSGGTEVTVRLSLSLEPLLGPLAAFTPHDKVAAVIAPDLEKALLALERSVTR